MWDWDELPNNKKVTELVEYVQQCCDAGLPVDIGKAVFTTSLNSLSNTFFSMDLASHADNLHPHEFKELVWKLLEMGGKPNISDFFPLVKHLDLQGVLKKITVYVNKMMGIFEEIIDNRLNKGVIEDDVLGTLLKIVDNNGLSLDDVRHLLLDMFIGGMDTVSNTLEWTMTELLCNPQKMKKAQKEVDKVLSKERSMQDSDISRLPYVQAIVKETLRLHPPD